MVQLRGPKIFSGCLLQELLTPVLSSWLHIPWLGTLQPCCHLPYWVPRPRPLCRAAPLLLGCWEAVWAASGLMGQLKKQKESKGWLFLLFLCWLSQAPPQTAEVVSWLQEHVSVERPWHLVRTSLSTAAPGTGWALSFWVFGFFTVEFTFSLQTIAGNQGGFKQQITRR